MADTLKVLWQIAPSDGNAALAYTAPAGGAMVSTLVVSNWSAATDAPFTIWLVLSGESQGTNKQQLYPGVTAPAADPFAATLGLTLAAGDAVYVQAPTHQTLTFHGFGTEPGV